MTGFTYLHVWEIVDVDRPASQLIETAKCELPELAWLSRARLTGDPKWTVSGNRLICRAPARPVADLDEPIQDAPATRPLSPHVVQRIQLMSARGWSNRAIAGQLRVDRKTVIKYVRRGRAAA